MAELGDAYYPSSLDDDNGSVPKGRYTATITDLSISNNVKFGNFIADVFKPEYTIDKKDHPPYDGCKGLRKEGGEGGQLPFLYLNDIKGSVVLVDVFTKKFTNDFDSQISYSVGRAIQLQNKAEVPF